MRTPKLNKNAQALVNRLKKTRIKQGFGQLHNTKTGTCALGVACRLYQEMVGGLKVDKGYSGDIMYDKLSAVMPEKVRKFFGFKHNCGFFLNSYGNKSSITELNDVHELSFKKIAELIESKPRGMFVRGR